MSIFQDRDVAAPSRVFLHFVNRELHDSLSISPDLVAALRAIRLLTIFSDLPMACNISQVYEFGYLHASFIHETIALSGARILELDCAFPTFDEFHDSRRLYYGHDFNRYPMYSSDDMGALFAEARIDSSIKIGSTTDGIQSRIESLIREGGRGVDGVLPYERRILIDRARDIRSVLDNRDNAGLTYALFPARGVRLESSAQVMALRRALTASYIEHYQSELNAVVPINYPRLGYYDACSRSESTRFNLEWLELIFQFSRIGQIIKGLGGWGLEARISAWGAPEHLLLARRVAQLGAGLDARFQSLRLDPDRKKYWIRTEALRFQRCFNVSQLDCSLQDGMIQLSQNIHRLGERLSGASIEFETGWNRYEAKGVASVLFMTATDTEDDALFSVLKRAGAMEIGKRSSSANLYTEFQLDQFRRLVHVRSSAGSVGSNSALPVALEAIQLVNPKYVMSVGICFGLLEKKQKLGDVVVSTAIKFYEPGKIAESGAATSFVSRGDRVTAGAALIDRARAARRDWSACKVHQGLIVSGEKLVNAEPLRAWLKNVEPEAIAGEMEGAGVVSAGQRLQREWIVVKGIADWGKKKKDGAQYGAAENAMRFSLEIAKLLPTGG